MSTEKILDASEADVVDPLEQWFKKSWRQLLITGVVVFAGYYGVNAFFATQEQARARGGDLLVRIQNELQMVDTLSEEVVSSPIAEKQGEASVDLSKQETLAKAEQGVTEALRALQDAKAPYDVIAALYQFARADSSKNAVQPLQSTDETLQSISAIASIRKQFDKASADPTIMPQTISTLTDLVRNGRPLPAVTSLALLSRLPDLTKEQVADARSAAFSLQERAPEQMALVTELLKKMTE